MSVCYALLTALDICCISLVSQNSQSSGQNAYSTYTKNPTPLKKHMYSTQTAFGRLLLHEGDMTIPCMKETKDFPLILPSPIQK